MKKINHWINGKNVAGSEYFQTTNPASGEVLAEVPPAAKPKSIRPLPPPKRRFRNGPTCR